MTARLSHLHGIPYVVHLEDNEDAILSSYFDVSIPLRTWRRLRLSLNPKERPLPHPKRYKEFISNASGATVLIEELKDFVPTHVPTTVIWPACEDYISNMPLEPNLSLREQLGIPRHHLVLTYPGNVHQNNLQDVEDLYQAVRLCRKRNLCVSLIRIGRNYVPLNRDFSDDEGTCFVELGEIPPKDIPRFVQAADILVQPGRNTPFNHYRFPSKLPMFLASGRPVILGYTSVANQLSHGRNAIILAENTPEEIAEAIEMLAESPEERIRLGNAGRKFAREQFSWKRSVQNLLVFYERILA